MKSIGEKMALGRSPMAIGVLVWAGVVTAAWIARYHTGPAEWWEGFRRFFLNRQFSISTLAGNWAVFLPAIAALPGFLALFRTAGERLLPLIRGGSRRPDDGPLDALLAGFAIIGAFVFGAGLCGLLPPIPAKPAIALLVAWGIADIVRRPETARWWMGGGGLGEGWRAASLPVRPFLALAAIITAAHVLGMETGWDALTYHLRFPMLFELRHKVFDVWHHPAGTFPMHGEMLFTLARMLDGDTLVRLMVAVWGLLTLAAARRLMIEATGNADGRLTAVLVASPLFILLCTRAYTDIPVMLFGTGAWYAWLGWRRTGRTGLAAFSGALAGAAMGCKYTAFLLLPAFAAAWWLVPGRGRTRRAALLWLAAATVFAGPWLARNWLIRGNPIHPFLSAWMGMAAPRLPDMALPFEGAGTGGKVLATTFGGRIDALLYGDGRITGPIAPVFAAFLPLLLFSIRAAGSALASLRYGTLVFLAFWLALCPDVRFLAPVLAPAFVLILASLNRAGGSAWFRRPAHWILQAGLAAGALFGAGYQWTTFAPFSMPLGLESRRDKLEMGLRPAPFFAYALRAAQEAVPPSGRVLAVCAVHSYYLDREVFTDVHYGRAHVTTIVREGRDERGIARRLRQRGVGWVLAADDLAGNFAHVPGFFEAPRSAWEAWANQLARRGEAVWQTDGFVLYRLGRPHPARPLPCVPPIDTLALAEAGRALENGRPSLALNLLDRLPGVAGNTGTARMMRAQAYAALRDFRKALAQYDSAVRTGLDTPGTDLGRARALYAMGKPAEAAKSAMRALERNPRSAYANGLLAVILAERGAMAQARTLAQRAEFLDPDEPQYQRMLKDMGAREAR